MRTRTLAALLVVGAAALALTACSAATRTGAGASGSDGIRVVASTNVYGSIATIVGGSTVTVTAIMSDPAQDPHSFQASAQNQLAISRAAVVISNGGGYDDWMGTMLAASKNTKPARLDAVAISGLKPDAKGDLNEHVWYDLGAMRAVADRLAATLSTIDPAHATAYSARARAFDTRLSALEAREAALRVTYAGTGVAVTEPVPLYMLDAIGLVDKTPPAFSHAIEQGTDVSPMVLRQTLDTIQSGAVKLLARNAQTTGPETDRAVAAAKSAGVPVVPVTETVPAGTDYVGWMSANLDAIGSALAGGTHR